MRSFDTDGIVLKVRHTGESDRIVTVLTRDYGVISAFAKSSRRPKSKLHAGTQTFCFSDFSFARSGETFKITDAVPKEVFYDLNSDISSLSLAQYFGQIAAELVNDDDTNSENLRLILNSINFLCSGKRSKVFVKAVTELRLCVNAGYAPELFRCAKCGGEVSDGAFFNCADGVVYCTDCLPAYNGEMKIGDGVLSALRAVAYSPFDEIYSFRINKDDLGKFGRICEKYIILRTERSYSALDFYRKEIE